MSELTPIILECGGCTAPLSETIITKGVHKCPFCGYVNILPRQEQASEIVHHLRNADAELRDGEFERAYNAYSRVIELDSSEAKAHYGMALAKNKIKYVKDLVNHRWQAICCEVTDKKFSEDASFLRALECATEEQKEEFTSRAREIDYIREKFLELQNTGLDYDTFICVKVSDGEGGFTSDSHWAGKLYDNIKKAGMKPFYSERDIGDRVGEDYEALILYALHSSESMIIVCSNEDYLRTPWVQNEYTRYYSMLNGDEKAKNSIMIAFSEQIIERIPGILGKIQGVDLHSFDASQKINEFVSKHANAEERARKEAEEKARAEAERLAEKEAERKAREEQQRALEELRKKVEQATNLQVDNRVKYCTSCSAENKLDMRFCYLCGASEFKEVDEKFCTNCKERVTLATKRCKMCKNEHFVYSLEECEKIIAKRKAENAAREARAAKREEQKAAKLAEASMNPVQDNNAKSKEQMMLERRIQQREEFEARRREYAKMGFKLNGTELKKYSGKEPNVEIPEGVTSIAQNAFYGNKKITSVTIPSTVKTIGEFAFSLCVNLQSVTIVSGVDTIKKTAFGGCTGLKKVNFLGSIKRWCYISFEDAHSNPVYHANNLFLDDIPLTILTIPAQITEVKDFAFCNCFSLKSISLHSGITKIGRGALPRVLHIHNKSRVRLLSEDAEIIQQGFDKSVIDVVDDYIFMAVNGRRYLVGYAGNKSEIVLPNGYKGNFYEIYHKAFFYRHDITKVTIPESVTSIGAYAFCSCKALSSISIPHSIRAVGAHAFAFCSNLTIDCYVKKPLFGLPDGFDKFWLGNDKDAKVRWVK